MAALDHFRRERVRPLLKQIAEHIGLRSKSNIHQHLVDLEGMGLLKRDYMDPSIVELKVKAPPEGTPRKDRIAFFVLAGLLAQLNRTPRYDEIASVFGTAKSTAHDRVRRLVKAGLVRIDYLDEHVFELAA